MLKYKNKIQENVNFAYAIFNFIKNIYKSMRKLGFVNYFIFNQH